MNIEIKNIHAIQSLVEHHSEKVISISGKADNSKAKEILELVENEKMKYRETITKGFENAPQALRDVLTGKNFGKQIIEV